MIATFLWPGLSAADDLNVLTNPAHAAAVEVVAGWERERTLLLAKGLASTAVSLMLAFVVAGLDEKDLSAWWVALAAAVELVMLAVAGVLLYRVRALGEEFARIVSGSVGR